MKNKNIAALIFVLVFMTACLTSCVKKAKEPLPENKEPTQDDGSETEDNKTDIVDDGSETEDNKTDIVDDGAEKTPSKDYRDRGFPFFENQDLIVSAEAAQQITEGMTYHEIVNRLKCNGWQCGSGVLYFEWILDNGQYLLIRFGDSEDAPEDCMYPYIYERLGRPAARIYIDNEPFPGYRTPSHLGH